MMKISTQQKLRALPTIDTGCIFLTVGEVFTDRYFNF